MKYDPIKKRLGKFFNTTPALRIIFYKLLDLLLLRAWHIKKELRKFNSTHQSAGEILDAGAGFGQYTYRMSQLNKKWKITSVDVKAEQITDCNNFFNKIGEGSRVTFAEKDLTQYKNSGFYDLILCVDVMEHIEEDVLVLTNFYESLKDKGVLLISTPSDQGGSDVHDDDEHSFIEEHVRNGYNILEMKEKLEKAGFDAARIHLKYSYGKSGSLSWRLSMKYPIKMLNATKLSYILLPFYYIIFFPVACILNYFDLNTNHKKGTGLIVRAVK